MSAFEPSENDARDQSHLFADEFRAGEHAGGVPAAGPTRVSDPTDTLETKKGHSVDSTPVSLLETSSCERCAALAEECAAKDALIAQLNLQLTRLRGCLCAIETLAERQASHESSSEHDLLRLERKLQAYREALRKCTGASPESDISGPSLSPWGSIDEELGMGETGTTGTGMPKFPRRVPSGDELGLHKVHGGSRYEPSLDHRHRTGMETETAMCHDETDQTMQNG